MESIRASTAMAVYNGEPFIRQQIDSILERMGPDDELVISYDPSTDGTRAIIDGYAAGDCRVRVVENPGKPGVQNNFSSAVSNCRGKYIFLADQDDVWVGDKINTVVAAFERTGADLVIHDGQMADRDLNPVGESIFRQYGTYNSPIRNIIKCNFWGCCMAFRREVWQWVKPFPNTGGVGHDLWLGVIVGFRGKIARIDDCLMLHRLHGSNVTVGRRALPVILRHRAELIRLLILQALHRRSA